MPTRGQVIRTLTSAIAILAVLAGSLAPMLACPSHCCFISTHIDTNPGGTSKRGSQCACCKSQSMKSRSATKLTGAPQPSNDSLPCTCDLSPAKAVTASRACEQLDASSTPSGWLRLTPSPRRPHAALGYCQISMLQRLSPADAPFALISRIQI